MRATDYHLSLGQKSIGAYAIMPLGEVEDFYTDLAEDNVNVMCLKTL